MRAKPDVRWIFGGKIGKNKEKNFLKIFSLFQKFLKIEIIIQN